MFRPFLTLIFAFAAACGGLPALAQTTDDAVRVTVTMNPDGSKTVYQTDGANRRSTAITTGANGKTQGKIIYRLDGNGRYESGEVFAASGTLRFKTRYRSDAAGHLLEETQLAKDDSVQNRIVYSYDASGHSSGYAIYDGDGRLLGRTTAKKPAAPGQR
ncbi:MAG: hypothetical protein H0W43_05070 [Chthoniobacterales bacterium]|nr:hypothetical protein [Chthoniobacterales bacterium]